MEEIWKDVKGYEGLYQVSNYGRIKSLNYNNWKREEILKNKLHRDGYLKVTLGGKDKLKYCLVHRIVAEAFIPNPNNYPQVNHKDENKQNNNVNNLEWCTAKYNSNYGTHNERVSKKQKGKIISQKVRDSVRLANSKVVGQFKIDTMELVNTYASTVEAATAMGVSPSSIRNNCRGDSKTACGYIFRYL